MRAIQSDLYLSSNKDTIWEHCNNILHITQYLPIDVLYMTNEINILLFVIDINEANSGTADDK